MICSCLKKCENNKTTRYDVSQERRNDLQKKSCTLMFSENTSHFPESYSNNNVALKDICFETLLCLINAKLGQQIIIVCRKLVKFSIPLDCQSVYDLGQISYQKVKPTIK